MEWLLEHPQVFVILAGALAYMVRRRRPAADDKRPEQAASKQPVRGAFERATRSSQDDERARQIREEMIRRREQRTGVPIPRQASAVPRPAPMAPSAPPPPRVAPSRPIVAPSPVFRDPMAEMMKEIARRFQQEESPEPARAQVQADAELQDRLNLLQARIAVLEREKAAANERAKVYGTGATNPAMPPGDLTAGAVVDDLASNVSLRRAIILNEVLGRPIALR